MIKLLQAPGRWDVYSTSLAEVLSQYRSILSKILPRSLLPLFKDMHVDNLPYSYCTVKKKCFMNYHELTHEGSIFRGVPGEPVCEGFSPICSHTCRKPKHSCLRTICSFKGTPGRCTFEKIGRAIHQLMDVAYPGKFSLCDLSRAREEVLRRLSGQAPRPPPPPGERHVCVGCGAPMDHPTLRTDDAGQAYEVIPRTIIDSATQDLFKHVSRITGAKDPTVTVIHRTKA